MISESPPFTEDVKELAVDSEHSSGAAQELIIKKVTSTTAAITKHEENVVKSTWEQLMGKDLLMKSIHISNDDATSVQIQSAVMVDFVGWYSPECPLDHSECSSGSDDNIFHLVSDWLIVIGEKDVIPVLEMGIRFMKKGQTCLLWCHSKYAYGPAGRKYHNPCFDTQNKILQPNSNVMYRVTVKDVIQGKELDDSDFKIKLCESKKNIANDIYNYELIVDTVYAKNRAIMMYKRAADMLEYMIQRANDIQKQENADNEIIEQHATNDTFDYQKLDTKYAMELYLDCLNNITAVYMVCKDYHAAKEAAIHVLTRDPHNIKGLIRAAKASLLDPASTFEEVNESIQAAVDSMDSISSHTKQMPDPKLVLEIEKLKNEFYRKKKQHKERQKQMSANITKGLQKNYPKNDKQNRYSLQHDDSASILKTDSDLISDVATTPITLSPSSDTKGSVGFSSDLFFRFRDRFNDWIQQHPEMKNMIRMYAIQIVTTLFMIWYFKPSQNNKHKANLQPQSAVTQVEPINDEI